MPKRTGVRGKVQATKPLSYQGKLIQNFWIEFEEGKAVRWHAEEEEAALASLIQFDEGSAYLGEVCIDRLSITPISQPGFCSTTPCLMKTPAVIWLWEGLTR